MVGILSSVLMREEFAVGEVVWPCELEAVEVGNTIPSFLRTSSMVWQSPLSMAEVGSALLILVVFLEYGSHPSLPMFDRGELLV